MIFSVYIFFSKKLNRFYVGSTLDMINRLSQHNSGQSTYTSLGVPWQLIWTASKSTRVEAETLELKIQNLSHERKINFMLKYNDGIIDQLFFDNL